MHLFIKKDGITAEMRSEGMDRLQRRDRVTAAVRRVLSLLLPGAGQILAGRIGVGFPVMMGWVCAIIFMVARERLLLAPRVPVSDLPPPGVVAAVVLMGILWLVGNTTSTRRPMMTELTDGA